MTKRIYSCLIMMLLAIFSLYSQPGQSGAYQKDAVVSEFFENFDQVTAPALPDGWTSIIQSQGGGNVATVTSTFPYSAPNHVRMSIGNDLEGTVMLVGPKVDSFQSNWLRFQSKIGITTHEELLVVGYIPNRENYQDFVAVDTLLVQFHINRLFKVAYNEHLTDESNQHIAFKFIPGTTGRYVHLDDIYWETAPTEPIMTFSPDSHEFSRTLPGSSSSSQEFVIVNDGAIPITLTPEDISISGADASDFSLNNIQETVTLRTMRSATISVVFSPEQLGEKQAVINIKDKQIPIGGTCVYTDIVEFPHYEDFDELAAPGLPFGWSSIVNNSSLADAVVETFTGNSPISEPNHLRLFSNHDPDAVVMAITPLVENLAGKRIRFSTKSNLSSNSPTLIVGGMTDPNDASTFVAFEQIEGLNTTWNHVMITFDSTMENINYLVFRHGGTPQYNRSIFVDNLLIEETPDGPLQVVTPLEWDFSPTQIQTISQPKAFAISNEGISNLVITSEDVFFTGEDAGRFVAHISEPIVIEPWEEADLPISYAPEALGTHQAILNIGDTQIPLSGSSFDATITEIPHFENFDSVVAPEIPFGWSTIVYNPGVSNAVIQTSTIQSPFSEPYHIRMNSNNHVDAEVLLASPPIVDLGIKRVRFYSKCNVTSSVPDLVVGTMSNPHDASTFNAIDTIFANTQLTNAYNELFTVNFGPEVGEDRFIGFRFSGNSSTARVIYIDDVTIENMPDAPIIHLSPDSVDFIQVQTGEVSNSHIITIKNDGGGVLTINPEDITLEGENASAFILHNIEQPVDLQAHETADISVYFAPSATGNKNAKIKVGNRVVYLTGEAIDATIGSFPWTEDFSSELMFNQLPFGWKKTHFNWHVGNEENAGGTAPELRLVHFPVFQGKGIVTSPRLNTSGIEEMQLSFKHFINNYNNPGPYTLRVYTVVGETQYLITEWVDPDNVGPEALSFNLTSHEHGIGSSELYIAWEFEGNSNAITGWYVDDLSVSEIQRYTVTFNITDPQNNEIDNAVITFDGNSNPEGDYVFSGLTEGSYSYSIVAPGFNEFSQNDFHLAADSQVDVQLEHETYHVQFEVNSQGGIPVADAVITLGEITNAPGDYDFNVLPGTMDYQITAEGFHDLTYQGLVVSENITVNAVLEAKTYKLSFEVKNLEDELIDNATITLNDEAFAAGVYLFEDLLPGNYEYKVSKEGYFDYEGIAQLISEDLMITVSLEIDNLSVPENHENQFSIYPNPAASVLNINAKSGLKEIQVIDMTGRVYFITQAEGNNYELNLSGFRNGTYFLKLTTYNETQVIRFQVIK